MAWQVDGGQLNDMTDNTENGPHKHADVDVHGWTWKGNGPYQITVIAKDLTGKEISRATTSITISQ